VASGRFVTVSGVDGSGKSTLATHLASRARALGRWPQVMEIAPLKGDAELVRRITALPAPVDRWEVRERWLAGYFGLMLADAGTARIAPALRDGALVIADRWITDHVVNQEFFGVDLAEWQPLYDLLPKPYLAVWVDVPVGTALRRVATRARPGVGSGEEFLRFATARFADLAGPTHLRVDGTAPVDETATALLTRLLGESDAGAAA